MFAVVELAGHQYKVAPKDVIKVGKLDLEEGKKGTCEAVLLVSDDGGKKVEIGKPYVSGAMVEYKVLKHGRAEKITVFKMKAKKRYARTQGHRQDYTEVEITGIKG